MLTDEELVASSLAGSEAAFTELVARYRERLLRFLLARAASRADAEDAVQDTLVNAYRYLESFDPRWRFSTWIYRIAIRNLSRQASQALRGADCNDAEAVDTLDPLAECQAQSERDNLWLVARQELAPDACHALWLHYVEDMPLGDVARTLERSLAWTKVTLMRSRRRLRARMDTPAVVSSPGASHG